MGHCHNQQASHLSWVADSYFPYAQYLYDYVKKYAPQAEVVIQQTWSYRCDDGRFGKGQWKITQRQMYEKLSEAYAAAAKKLGIRQIPSGDAVELAREMAAIFIQANRRQNSQDSPSARSAVVRGRDSRKFLLEEKSEDRRA